MSDRTPYSILIADDNPDNLRVLSSMLEEQGYGIRMSCNGEQALKSIQIKPPDLIMLDIHMPVLDGYDTCRKLKSDDRYKDIPVIFVSAMNEGFNKMLAYEVGGIDYIVKPFQLEEVITRVGTQLSLFDHLSERSAHCSDCKVIREILNVAKEMLNCFKTIDNLSEEQLKCLEMMKNQLEKRPHLS